MENVISIVLGLVVSLVVLSLAAYAISIVTILMKTVYYTFKLGVTLLWYSNTIFLLCSLVGWIYFEKIDIMNFSLSVMLSWHFAIYLLIGVALTVVLVHIKRHENLFARYRAKRIVQRLREIDKLDLIPDEIVYNYVGHGIRL